MAAMTDAKRIGNMGEAAAEGYLRKKGYEILARNYHIPGGEIDIIAADKEYIIFAEVKTRNASSIARPSAWVNKRKQKKLILTASQYIEENDCELQPRFDVIEVVYDMHTEIIVSIEHIEDAFMQTGDYAVY